MAKQELTAEERLKLFTEALQKASEEYGCSIAAQVRSEALGPVVQVRAEIMIVPTVPQQEPKA